MEDIVRSCIFCGEENELFLPARYEGLKQSRKIPVCKSCRKQAERISSEICELANDGDSLFFLISEICDYWSTEKGVHARV